MILEEENAATTFDEVGVGVVRKAHPRFHSGQSGVGHVECRQELGVKGQSMLTAGFGSCSKTTDKRDDTRHWWVLNHFWSASTGWWWTAAQQPALLKTLDDSERATANLYLQTTDLVADDAWDRQPPSH